MPGVKGKSGGQRAGAGRRAKTEPVATIALSSQAQLELSILTRHNRIIRGSPKLSQRQVAEELIHAAWLELDELWQAKAEEIPDAP